MTQHDHEPHGAEPMVQAMAAMVDALADAMEQCLRRYGGPGWIDQTNQVRQQAAAGLSPLKGAPVTAMEVLTTLAAFDLSGQWSVMSPLFPTDDPRPALRQLFRCRASLDDDDLDPEDARQVVADLMRLTAATRATAVSSGRRAEGYYVTTPLFGRGAARGAALEFQFRRSRAPAFNSSVPPDLRMRREDSKNAALVVQLLGQGLEHEGASALAAVVDMHVPHRLWRFIPRRLATLVSEHLKLLRWTEQIHVTPTTTLTGNPTESSMTLGMALGILMAGCKPDLHEVIATGDITASRKENARPVIPVGGISAKIQAILDTWSPRRHDVPFFVPYQDKDANPLPPDRAHFDQIFKTEIAALKRLNVTLVPVATLEQAARHIKATRLAPTLFDYLAVAGLGCMMAAGGIHLWHERPVKMEWLAPPGLTVAAHEAPLYRAKNLNDDEVAPLTRDERGAPAVCDGESVGVCVRIAADTDVPVRVGAVLAANRVSSDTLPKIARSTDGEDFVWLKPGEDTCLPAKVNTPGDTNALFYIAERWPGSVVSQSDLNKVFRAPDDSVPPSADGIARVQGYLESRYPGRVRHVVFNVIKKGGKECL